MDSPESKEPRLPVEGGNIGEPRPIRRPGVVVQHRSWLHDDPNMGCARCVVGPLKEHEIARALGASGYRFRRLKNPLGRRIDQLAIWINVNANPIKNETHKASTIKTALRWEAAAEHVRCMPVPFIF